MSDAVVSFCVFGNDYGKVYYDGAIKQAALFRARFPSFKCVYYLGRTVPVEVCDGIKSVNPNSDFIYRRDLREDQTFTYTRFLAIREYASVPFIFFRDVDSRLNEREATAMEEYMANDNFVFHMMRDHHFHGRYMMAGMWGIGQPAYSSIRLVDDIQEMGDWYQVDQTWLELYVWPHARRTCLVHLGTSRNVYERVNQRRPFRVPRERGEFVGMGFKGDDSPRHPEHLSMVEEDADLLGMPKLFLEEFRG